MRNILTSLLVLLGFVRAAVVPQQPDTTARARPDTTARARDTFAAERPTPTRRSMSAAERRRRYPDIIEGADGVKDWEGSLPETGQYIIHVGTDVTAAYTLEVTIR